MAFSGAKVAIVSAASVLLLSACGGSTAGDTFGNLLAFNSVNAPPLKTKPQDIKVSCPEVDPSYSDSTVRVYAGPNHSNDTVKYQYDIAHFARECHVQGGDLQIKVGVEGRVIIGPAGAAGTFVAPVRIAIKRQSDDKVLVEKIYRTTVNVPSGVGVATFQTISDPLTVPFTGEHADQAYSITVGFASGGKPEAHQRRPRRRR